MVRDFIKCDKCQKISYDVIENKCTTCGSTKQNSSKNDIPFDFFETKNLLNKTSDYIFYANIVLPLVSAVIMGIVSIYANVSIIVGIIIGIIIGYLLSKLFIYNIKLKTAVLRTYLNNAQEQKENKKDEKIYSISEPFENFIPNKGPSFNDNILTESFTEKILKSYEIIVEKYEQEKELRLAQKDREIDQWKKALKRRDEILNEKDKRIEELSQQ